MSDDMTTLPPSTPELLSMSTAKLLATKIHTLPGDTLRVPR